MAKQIMLKITECDGCFHVNYKVKQLGGKTQVDMFCSKLNRLVCLGIVPRYMPDDCPLLEWEDDYCEGSQDNKMA